MGSKQVFDGPLDLLEWNGYELWPNIKSFSRLAMCTTNPKGHELSVERELEKLIKVGILSRSSQGNFRMVSSLHPDFSVGPKIGNDGLYFVTRGEATNVAKKISSGGLSVISDSDYALPDKLSAEEWHVVRRKLILGSPFEREYLKDALIKKDLVLGVHSLSFQGNPIAVFYQPSSSHSRKYIGLAQSPSTREENRLYFLRREDAEAYLSALPFKTVIGIPSKDR